MVITAESEREESDMKIKVEVPEVASCQVQDCAYNRERLCHARAITVGDGAETPNCDTYYPEGSHAVGTQKAGVGACKVTQCKYNEDLECQAESINVGYRDGEAYCLTFDPR